MKLLASFIAISFTSASAVANTLNCDNAARSATVGVYEPLLLQKGEAENGAKFGDFNAMIGKRDINGSQQVLEIAVQEDDAFWTYKVSIETKRGRCDITQILLIDQE